ncbi:hypothetical protein [Desulfonema magnum]|uniref:hypothetical protein n=1 Tax=Desulfonema magnum TaxID=45655 RepID=UPI001A9BA0FD|nr:hypothetical protein [Desulfonema magnum]
MQKSASLYFCTPGRIYGTLCKKPLRSIFALRAGFTERYAKNRFALFLHSGPDLRNVMQKTASLYFCTPGRIYGTLCKKPLRSIFALRAGFTERYAKNRFALFLHSGPDLRNVMQKTASLYFCTPGRIYGTLCKKPLRSIFALRAGFTERYAKNRFALFLHSGPDLRNVMQKTASLYFCTPGRIYGTLCKKPLRSIFALRAGFTERYAKKRFALFLHSGPDLRNVMQKTASLYFCTPGRIYGTLCKKPLRSIFALRAGFTKRYAKNRFALFLHSGPDLRNVMQKTASLYFCTPGRIYGTLCKKPLRSIFALRAGFTERYAKNRFALFLHSGPDLRNVMQKTASLYFCTPDL